MKTSKIIAFISLIGFITVSCEKDPKPTPTPDTTSETQKVIGTDFTTIGTYTFSHGEFVFEKQALTAPSTGDKDGTSKSSLIRIYENTAGVQKAVLKNSDGKFLAFFMRNIEDEKMEINMDNATEKDNFDTVEKAINSKYPDANAGMDHANMKFGWITITKKVADTPNPPDPEIKLPINGRYVSTDGHNHAFDFRDDTILTNAKKGGLKSLTVLKYNTMYNKILAKTGKGNNVVYYVIQLKDFKGGDTAKIAYKIETSENKALHLYIIVPPLENFVEYKKTK